MAVMNFKEDPGAPVPKAQVNARSSWSGNGFAGALTVLGSLGRAGTATLLPKAAVPTRGRTWRTVIGPLLSSTFTWRINGVYHGVGNARRIGLEASCGLGPRSEIIQKMPGPSPGPLNNPLPMPPNV